MPAVGAMSETVAVPAAEPTAAAGAPTGLDEAAVADVCVECDDEDDDRAEEEGVVCIFCLERAEPHERITRSPCLCIGSMAALHKDCLREDLVKNLRLACSICRYPFRYDTKLRSHGFLGRLGMLLAPARNRLLFGVGTLAILIFGALALALQLLAPGFNSLPFAYVAVGVCFVTVLYFGVSINELPVHTIQVALLEPTDEEREQFRRAPEETRRMRQQQEMQSVARSLKRGLELRAQRNPLEIVAFGFPITLQMIADQNTPPSLRALVNRSQEAAHEAREATMAAAQEAADAPRAALAPADVEAATSGPVGASATTWQARNPVTGSATSPPPHTAHHSAPVVPVRNVNVVVAQASTERR